MPRPALGSENGALKFVLCHYKVYISIKEFHKQYLVSPGGDEGNKGKQR